MRWINKEMLMNSKKVFFRIVKNLLIILTQKIKPATFHKKLYNSSMKPVFYTATDKGLVRTVNQDYLLADEKNSLFVVADGMGGHQGGEVASRLAVEEISKHLDGKGSLSAMEIIEEMKIAFTQANTRVFNEGEKNPELRGMGTTLCVFFLGADGMGYIGHVGDSRIYLAKQDNLWQITEDHSFTADQIKVGLLLGRQDMKIPASHFLTRSVGFLSTVQPDFSIKKTEKGEIYILCSDGLSGFVNYEVIKSLIFNHPVERIAGECLKKALSAGGGDNVSVIVVEIA